MRCSTDHHNLLVQQAPLNFLHHTAWEVDDVDEVGRGATRMLRALQLGPATSALVHPARGSRRADDRLARSRVMPCV
jgi:hypothetical protein